MRQAINETNYDPIQRRKHAALLGDQLPIGTIEHVFDKNLINEFMIGIFDIQRVLKRINFKFLVGYVSLCIQYHWLNVICRKIAVLVLSELSLFL